MVREKNGQEELAKLGKQFILYYLFPVLATVPQYLMLAFLPSIPYNLAGWRDIPCQLSQISLP